MSRPVEPSVLALWRRFAEANGFVALAKIVCVDATALFGLRQCSIGLHDPDGRPFIVVDNVVAVSPRADRADRIGTDFGRVRAVLRDGKDLTLLGYPRWAAMSADEAKFIAGELFG